MRIITGFLSVVGVAALVVLAVFGGVYLMDRYSASNTTSANTPANDPGVASPTAPAQPPPPPAQAPTPSQQEPAPAPAAPEASAGANGFCSTLTDPCTWYVVEKACTSNTYKGETLYSNHADPTHFICVHPSRVSPWLTNSELKAQSETNPSINPYCASLHAAITCSATRPITQADLT